MEKRMNALEARIAYLESVLLSGRKAEDLIEKHGEVVTKKAAAEILGISRATVYTMLADGRLEAACGGTRVSTRSLQAYIDRRDKA